jgi:hypothetical protein
VVGDRDSGARPDLAGPVPCSKSPCDLVCQNCATSQKCSLDDRNQVACMPGGRRLPGESCGAAGADDCAAGSVCLAVTLDGAGSACFRYCRTDGDCAGAGCTIAITGSSANACGEAVSACTLVPQGGCPLGTACFVVEARGDTGCHVAGSGGLGTACASDYDCLPGFACFQSPSGCQRLCRTGVSSDCDGGSCSAVTGWTGDVGICV